MPVAISAVFVFLIAFAGSAIQAAVGFGFVILCMALFPMFLPIDQCLVTAQVGGALASLWLLFGSFRKIDLRYVAFPACFGAAGSLAGLVFLGSISTGAYMRALGVILVALAIWMWKFSGRVKIKPSPLSGSVCGIAAGILGSVFGVSVPPLVLYYSSNMDNKDDYMVPLQATLAIQTCACLIGRAALGMWPASGWQLLPAAAAGLVLGKYPGRWIYRKLNTEKFKLVIYIFVAVLGIYTFLSA